MDVVLKTHLVMLLCQHTVNTAPPHIQGGVKILFAHKVSSGKNIPPIEYHVLMTSLNVISIVS